MSLQLEKKHWNIIQQILSRHPYKFYAYGSRTKGTAKKFSDLDLCYQEEVPLSAISQLREEFTESNLPFEVEISSLKAHATLLSKSSQKRFNSLKLKKTQQKLFKNKNNLWAN